MLKLFLAFLISFSLLLFPVKSYALENSFVSVVNPIRGNDFWELKDQPPVVAVLGQVEILKQSNIPATWLVRPDVLGDSQLVSTIKSFPASHEIGLFLEITPTWTKSAGVGYRSSETWHLASSAFLTGYTPSEREKLIDNAFVNFKQVLGFYPKSVGAWYIDSYSLAYMQKKYGVTSALIVADQHTTDSYQIWGQYWSTPYYPSRKNTLMPAQNTEDKLPVVIMQWAARDPVNGYGKGVEESTYSVQPNDYIDYHNLSTDYFSSLIDIFTTQKLNQFGQVVIGLENSYSWKTYQSEYQRQINLLSEKSKAGQFSVATMGDFASWYSNKFTETSPTQIIVAQDPLGGNNYAVWFMNPFYRAGWFVNHEGSVFRDVRPYTEGREEQCFSSTCGDLNFATFALWTIDEITRNQKYIVDQGSVKDIQVGKDGDKYVLTYVNETGRKRVIDFMPRDIGVDNNIKSIDSFILAATSGNQSGVVNSKQYPTSQIKVPLRNAVEFFLTTVKFLLFVILALFIPGWLMVKGIKDEHFLVKLFLSISLGFVGVTLVSYLGGYLKVPWIIYPYVGLSAFLFLGLKCYRQLLVEKGRLQITIFKLGFLSLIGAGSIFQSLSMMRSGWAYDFGLGFWGPTGHDGIWHQALINQLARQVPPENPGFSGTLLSNYHYFYDLLVAVTYRLSAVPVLDLLYRFYPVLFSLLIGVGTYLLVMKFTQKRIAALISVYFVYFAGSFGWIVEYIRERHYGGESAFWANQPVSANLNPPFAVSLVLIIAILLVFFTVIKQRSLRAGILLVLLAGSLIEFKVYAGVIVLGGLLLTAASQVVFQRSMLMLKVFLGSLALSLVVFLPQNIRSGELLVFAPFWFVHSMVDFPDRVGWTRLSLARQAGVVRGEWFKFFAAESVSLFLFIAGNLGTRFIVIFSLITAIKKKLWMQEKYVFILGMSGASLLIPLLFIQKGNPWNTIQFFYYFIYFVAIFTGITLLSIFRKLPRKAGYLLVLLILIITPINAFVTFRSALYPSPPSRLTGGEFAALNFLQGLPFGVVLTHPFEKGERSKFSDPFPLLIYETSNYVSAFSEKPVFVEDEIQQEIFQNDYKKRIVGAVDFFKGRDSSWSEEFLKTNDIQYIYLPKIFNATLNAEALKLKKVYDNEEVVIFQTSI